jgi:hypothetical protein
MASSSFVKKTKVHGLLVDDVMNDGAIRPWRYAAGIELGVGVLRTSAALRRLRDGGLIEGRVRHGDAFERFVDAGNDLIIVYRGYIGGGMTDLRILARPGSSEARTTERARAIVDALRAVIAGSNEVANSSTPPDSPFERTFTSPVAEQLLLTRLRDSVASTHAGQFVAWKGSARNATLVDADADPAKLRARIASMGEDVWMMRVEPQLTRGQFLV